jgi:ribosomal RNA assembly protein
MDEIVRIPHDRIGALIGPKGNVKKKIIQETKTSIEIDSHEGEVSIEGEGEGFFIARDIVKAIGRGFSPQRAFTLLKKDYLLHIINLPDVIGDNSSNQEAKRGRVIGRKGTIRQEIEKKTNSFISVYGKTISIIALPNDMESAINATTMLLEGAQHETMEHFLENKEKTRFEL